LSTLSVAEFNKQTGKATYADAINQEIIDQAEREIQGWITTYGLTVATGTIKAASSLLSKAGLYERMHMDTQLSGDSLKYQKLSDKSKELRQAARDLILGIGFGTSSSTATVTPSTIKHYVIRVNP